MRLRIGWALAAFLVLMAGVERPAHAQEQGFAILSGGWSSPQGGPVADSYQSGFMLAGSYRTPVAPNFLTGLEVGYTWLSLDAAKLAERNPGSTFSGGDMGLLSITGENDALLGDPASSARPFLNLGLGFFRSFIDDATVTTGSIPANYPTGVYEGSFFGFHAGVGVLIHRERFGLRLDANYHYLFASGPDLEFFPVRVGIVFYPKQVKDEKKTGG